MIQVLIEALHHNILKQSAVNCNRFAECVPIIKQTIKQ